MIRRAESRRIARERLQDASALLRAGRHDGAIYQAGYVLELALKERICRTLRWSGFPQTRGEFQDYQSFRTHDLEVLLSLSGIQERITTRYNLEWSAVSRWNPEMRYNAANTFSAQTAEDFVGAVRVFREGNMNSLVSAAIDLEKAITQERGPFTFFALFQRRAFPGDWDLVAAAPWIVDETMDVLSYLVERFQTLMPKAEALLIGRVAPIVADNPYLPDLQESLQVKRGAVEVWNREFFGVEVRHAYIITAQRVGAGAEAVAA